MKFSSLATVAFIVNLVALAKADTSTPDCVCNAPARHLVSNTRKGNTVKGTTSTDRTKRLGGIDNDAITNRGLKKSKGDEELCFCSAENELLPEKNAAKLRKARAKARTRAKVKRES